MSPSPVLLISSYHHIWYSKYLFLWRQVACFNIEKIEILKTTKDKNEDETVESFSSFIFIWSVVIIMKTCSESCVKYTVFTFNLLFAAAGLLIICLGVFLNVKSQDFITFLDNTFINIPILFIVLGAVIFIIAFFACCGACSERSWMLYFFSVLMIVVLLTQFGSSIAAFVMKSQLSDTMLGNMYSSITVYNESTGAKESWDFLQQHLHCCGVNNSTDWWNEGNVINLNKRKKSIWITMVPIICIYYWKLYFWGLDTPSSCCSDQQSPCSDDSEDLYSDGCYQVMKEVFINNFGLVAGAFKEFYKFDLKNICFQLGFLVLVYLKCWE